MNTPKLPKDLSKHQDALNDVINMQKSLMPHSKHVYIVFSHDMYSITEQMKCIALQSAQYLNPEDLQD